MKPKKSKFVRYKLASIPVLVGVLVYVVCGAPSTEEDVGLSSPATPQLSDELQAGSVPAISSSPTPVDSHHPWPEVDLQFLSQPNPLASQRPTPPPTSSQQFTATTTEAGTSSSNSDHLQDMVRDLSGSPVKYVFRSDRRRLVMLGDQIFEKGEQLSESVQLHDIHNHALVLSHMEHDPSQRQLPPVID